MADEEQTENEQTPDESQAALKLLEAEDDAPPPKPAPKAEESEEPQGSEEEPDKAANDAAKPESAPTPAAAAEPEIAERYEKLAKALQENQQEVANLKKKIEAGKTLTEKEEKRLEQAAENAGNLETDLAELFTENPDLFGGVLPKLGKALMETEKKNKALEERLAKLEQGRQQEENARAQQDATRKYWAQEEKAHQGVNVREIWDTALSEAEKRPALNRAKKMLEANRLNASEYSDMLQEEASAIYHDRVKNAKASVDGRKAAQTKAPATTARHAPPNTPNGAVVVQREGGAPAPKSVDDELMDIATKGALAE